MLITLSLWPSTTLLVDFLTKNRNDCEPRADQCYLLSAKHEIRRHKHSLGTDSNIICLVS